MQLTKEALLHIYETAKRDLVTFRELFLVNADNKLEVNPAPFHYHWSDILLNQHSNFAIEGFRGCAKTQYISRAFPLYALTFPSPENSFIVLIKNTQTQASDKLVDIENDALSIPAIANQIVKVNKKTSEVFDVDILAMDGKIHNVRIQAFGKGASIRGLSYGDKRPTKILLDDIQDYEDVRSETTPERDWEWFLRDIAFLGSANSNIIMIGNNLGENCVIERIFACQGQLKETQFICVRIPAVDNEGRANWPEMMPLDRVDRLKEDYRQHGKLSIFYCEIMCEAVSDETRTFKKEYFQYYGLHFVDDILKKCNVYITIDPSISDSIDADPKAIVVAGLDKENYLFILDGWSEVCSQDMFYDKIFEIYMRWATRTRVQAVGMEQLKYYERELRRKMREKNIFFPLVELKHQGKKKEDRIEIALQPRFASKTVLFPDNADWLTMMIDQLFKFPHSLHDDLIDALAYVPQIMSTPLSRQKVFTQERLFPNRVKQDESPLHHYIGA